MKHLILLLSLILFSASYAESNKIININSFYEKFNMRSTESSMGPQLRYWCGSYPKQFFDIKEKKNNKLILVRKGDPELFWDVTFLKENKVIIYDRITSGTYSTEDTVQVVYINENDEWWDLKSVKSKKLVNPQGSACKKN